jgi:glycosyltransferase involved in cell wall biosynthesis
MAAPDFNEPAGGVRVLYRHVDILNAVGVRAAVMHRKPGFRCDWFENSTVVTDARSSPVSPADVIVVPEIHVSAMRAVCSRVPHVVLNQAAYLTWRGDSSAVDRSYRNNPFLRGVVCVSDHDAQLMRHAFPSTQVVRVHNAIDGEVFAPPPPPHQRQRRVAYMPRRANSDATAVLEILRGRGVLDGWDVVALDGLTLQQVARELRQSLVFLAFTRQEGFGLPAAEAMACGNYVIGNHGFGGRELFDPAHSRAVDGGDVLGFAVAVEEVLANELAEPGWCARRGALAAAFVARDFSVQREHDEVAAAYRHLLAPPSV